MSMSFDQKRVEFVFERPPLSPPYDVTHNQVFVSYDPSYDNGETAIVSFFFSDGRLVIAGMETHVSSDPGEERQVLYSHIDQLEACFPKCQIVLIIEGSFGESAKIWTHVLQKKYPNAAVYHECRERLFGIFTKTTSLGGLWEVLANKLSNDAIFLHDTIVCAGANNGRQEIVNELKKQMLAVRKVALVPPPPPFGASPAGRAGGVGARLQGRPGYGAFERRLQRTDESTSQLFGQDQHHPRCASRPGRMKRKIYITDDHL